MNSKTQIIFDDNFTGVEKELEMMEEGFMSRKELEELAREIEDKLSKAKSDAALIEDEEKRLLSFTKECARILGLNYAVADDDERLFEEMDALIDMNAAITLCDEGSLGYLCHLLANGQYKGKVACSQTYFSEYFDEETNHLCISEEFQIFARYLGDMLGEGREDYCGYIEDIAEIKDSSSVNVVRNTHPFDKVEYGDPVGDAMRSGLPSWRALLEAKVPVTEIVLWASQDEKAREYTTGAREVGLPDVLVAEYKSLPADHLRKVIQLLGDKLELLFKFTDQTDDCVSMIVVDDNGLSQQGEFYISELEANANYTPMLYLKGAEPVKTTMLGALSTKIQRGTSLSEGNLRVLRMADEAVEGKKHGGFSVNGWKVTSDDLCYIGISNLEDGMVTPPAVIDEIPFGQERYTVVPEDGLVLLFPRNGKRPATYVAPCPTLISNNLFIVRPDKQKIDLDYLGFAIGSKQILAQVDAMKKPISKKDLERLRIPVAPDEAVRQVVTESKKRKDKIRELKNEIALLSDVYHDPLTPLRTYAKKVVKGNGEGAGKC